MFKLVGFLIWSWPFLMDPAAFLAEQPVLVEAQQQIGAASQLLEAQIITLQQFKQAEAHFLARAGEKLGRSVTARDLSAAVVGTKSVEQEGAHERAAGLFNAYNVGITAGMVVFAICGFVFAAELMLWLIEIGLYLLGLYLFWNTERFAAMHVDWIVFGATLSIFVSSLVTCLRHEWFHNVLDSPRTLSLIYSVFFTAIALWWVNPIVGYLAVLAVMVTLGLSGVLTFGVNMFWHGDRKAVIEATLIGLLMLGVFLVLEYLQVLTPFNQAALYLGGTIGFGGLLVMCSRYYWGRERGYLRAQLFGLAVGVGAVFIGHVLDLPEVSEVAETFLSTWFVEKIIDIPAGGVVGWSLKGMVASGVVVWLLWYAKNNHQALANYLFF